METPVASFTCMCTDVYGFVLIKIDNLNSEQELPQQAATCAPPSWNCPVPLTKDISVTLFTKKKLLQVYILSGFIVITLV